LACPSAASSASTVPQNKPVAIRPVSRIAGHGPGVVPYPAWNARLQQSTDAAVQQLDGKLMALAE
jgi:hypothetical protein